jgi:hypothetical protein
MSVLDRILGRESKNIYTLNVNGRETVESTKPPQAFCSKCGRPMVDGYMVLAREFDTATGAPVKRIAKGRMCSAFHGQDRPAWVGDEDGHYPGSEDHDGFPYTGWWGDAKVDLIPDCEPRKASA